MALRENVFHAESEQLQEKGKQNREQEMNIILTDEIQTAKR